MQMDFKMFFIYMLNFFFKVCLALPEMKYIALIAKQQKINHSYNTHINR